MTVRLSQSSLTGTERTEVAVGTVSEESMLATVRAGAPRRTLRVGSSLASARAAGAGSFATGLLVPWAGSAAVAAGRGFAFGAGEEVLTAFCSVLCSLFCSALAGAGCSVVCSVLGSACFGAGFSAAAALAVPLLDVPLLIMPWELK